MRWLKRIVLTLIALVVIVLVALYCARFRAGYAVVDVTLEIAAPPEVVYAFISTPERVKQWVPALKESRSLTPGKTGVGAREQVVMDMDGESTELELEFTRLDPPRGLEMNERPLNAPSMDFLAHITYELTPTATGTRFREFSHTDYRTALGRMLEPIITRSATTMLTADGLKLKALAEAEQAKARPATK